MKTPRSTLSWSGAWCARPRRSTKSSATRRSPRSTTRISIQSRGRETMRTPVIAAIAALLSLPAVAAPVAGTDYQPFQPPQSTSDPSKIAVTDFFSYQCPHCARFAKPYEAWIAKLPADVKAERVAVSIGHEAWVPAAQAFYALTAMKKLPAID